MGQFSRPSPGAVAESLSAVENRDLLRRENAANWVSGILGICVAGARRVMALSQMDGRDGAVRSSEGQDVSVNVQSELISAAGSGSAFKNQVYFRPFP